MVGSIIAAGPVGSGAEGSGVSVQLSRIEDAPTVTYPSGGRRVAVRATRGTVLCLLPLLLRLPVDRRKHPRRVSVERSSLHFVQRPHVADRDGGARPCACVLRTKPYSPRPRSTLRGAR